MYYDISLSYFKQGDDLHHALEHFKTQSEALLGHAKLLVESAEILKKMASFAAENRLKVEDADCHHIGIECEPEVIEALTDLGLGVFEHDDDVEEDEMEEDGGDDDEEVDEG